jgi:peroxiredoxin (alkyl hydroperoxide reductase subunit C)
MSTCVNQKLAYHDDAIIHPQLAFPFDARPVMLGLDADGETIRKFNLAEECKDSYFVLCFFTMDFKADNSEILKLNSLIDEFKKNNTKVFGITQDSPYVSRHWTRKPLSRGGFGSTLGFPMLTDKDLYLSNLMGVSRPSGLPCRSTFVIDWQGRVRYMMCHKSEMGRSVNDILRIARAFRYSDLTGKITPAGWQPGDEVIPTDFTSKSNYYQSKYQDWSLDGSRDDRESISRAASKIEKAKSKNSSRDEGFISDVVEEIQKAKLSSTSTSTN